MKSGAIVKPRRNRINIIIDSRLDNQVDFILGCIKTNISKEYPYTVICPIRVCVELINQNHI